MAEKHTLMEPDLSQVRHDLLGKLNALTLCVTVLGKLGSQEADVEFIDMLIESADRLVDALDAYETAYDKATPLTSNPI